MRASKWRAALIGDLDLIHKLRQSTIIPPNVIRDQSTMDQDLKRTFPTVQWFNKDTHLNNISDILMAYAKVNPNIGYAQGMCFIVFVLYKVYYEDCPEYVVHDTFYSLHTLIHYIRPLYPRDCDDKHITKWLESTASIIRLKLLYRSPKLAVKLRNSGFIKLLLIKTAPALFANWFKIEDIVILWDYLFTGDTFENMLNAITAMIVCNRDIYLHLNEDKALQITAIKSFYKVSSVVSYAHTFQH